MEEFNESLVTARRVRMRNPIDRNGFGGHLQLAKKFPKFIETCRAGMR